MSTFSSSTGRIVCNSRTPSDFSDDMSFTMSTNINVFNNDLLSGHDVCKIVLREQSHKKDISLINDNYFY